jgi:hypothetical protein
MKFYRHTIHYITIHCIIPKYNFPRLNIYGKTLHGNSHYISTQTTCQTNTKTKSFRKGILVLISQNYKITYLITFFGWPTTVSFVILAVFICFLLPLSPLSLCALHRGLQFTPTFSISITEL